MLTAFHKEISYRCPNKNTQQCSLNVDADKLKTITTNKTIHWTLANNVQPQHICFRKGTMSRLTLDTGLCISCTQDVG